MENEDEEENGSRKCVDRRMFVEMCDDYDDISCFFFKIFYGGPAGCIEFPSSTLGKEKERKNEKEFTSNQMVNYI